MSGFDLLALMPLLILGCGSVIVLLAGAFLPQRVANVLAVIIAVAAAVSPAAVPAGSGSLGFTLSRFSGFFTVLFATGAAVTLLLSLRYNDRAKIRGEEYPATVLFGAFGMATVAGATDFLILFLGLEGLTFAFYILAAIDRESEESGEAGLKYLLNGAASAACNAFGIALIYAATGTLTLTSAIIASHGNPLALAGWCFLLTGLAFKISLVPFHLWTPDVYQGAPPPVAGFLSTGSKGATVAALLVVAPALRGTLSEVLWWLALLSMVGGNLAALRQRDIRRLLGYSSIAQMGYVALALVAANREGTAAATFYVVAYTAMNLAAFGAIAAIGGPVGRYAVEDYRGWGYRRPFAGAVLALSMFALAGIPPTAGFTGKFAIFHAALTGGQVLLSVIGIISAAASVYFYLRVVVTLYLQSEKYVPAQEKPALAEGCGLALAAVVIVVLGVYPGPLLDLVRCVVP